MSDKKNTFVRFIITGHAVDGRPFRLETKNARHADGINLYNGRVWGVMLDGKRKLLKRVRN